MNLDLIYALEQIQQEKGIDVEVLIEAIELALASAYKKSTNSQHMPKNIKVIINRSTGEIKVYSIKRVTSNLIDASAEIHLDDAKKIDPRAEEDDILEQEICPDPRKFGRIAAQIAKQVIMQRIREEERKLIADEFTSKLGELIIGCVQRIEKRNTVIIDLGKVEAILPQSEQVPGEEYIHGKKLKVIVLEVQNTSKGPQVIVSRSHGNLVKKLFEREVPEIYQGIVEFKGIGREAGSRTKMAVYSRNDQVDPVGACVGQKGVRVQAVVEELGKEKIDIIKWSSSPEEYIFSSLSPAKAIRVDINEIDRSAKVIVPDSQLSLAIGKEGQNARLAAKLTGWKIDIRSESQLRSDIEHQLLNFGDGSKAYDPYEQDFETDTNGSDDI